MKTKESIFSNWTIGVLFVSSVTLFFVFNLKTLAVILFISAFLLFLYKLIIFLIIRDDEKFERKMMKKGIDTRPFWEKQICWLKKWSSKTH